MYVKRENLMTGSRVMNVEPRAGLSGRLNACVEAELAEAPRRGDSKLPD